ncbi:MAG: hypothetical protein AAGA15_10495 [Pseudomonadota bacterium]
MNPNDAQARLATLRAEIALKYGVKGTLQKQVRKIGRALPRFERAQAAELVRLEQALAEGEMEQTIDARAFERAEMALVMHLEGVEAEERRRTFALDVTTTVLVNTLLGAAALAALFWLLRSM